MNDTFPQAVENKEIAENKGVLVNFSLWKSKAKKTDYQQAKVTC
ncbi:hypothetical protein ScFU53_10780 [Streptococcus canis]|nr:hypothetical protein [Streptococcus canis]MDW7797884.1 hypothetical protein [Streptococcus canis]GFE44176.1 hypothetical protein ScFU1_18550 [Streptococcus canis]GFE46386.1 hypothetical protein ScFU129_00170 [Streptococcus canis]GFG44066.1 hypothetical protein ScFU53_10780 [Streptococcus canis]GFG46071.1 hypothetical protein ScFU93_13170 [Streptococcus canis]